MSVIGKLFGTPPDHKAEKAGDGAQSKYLLSGSELGERGRGEDAVTTLEGSPTWHDAKEVRAVRAAGWP